MPPNSSTKQTASIRRPCCLLFFFVLLGLVVHRRFLVLFQPLGQVGECVLSHVQAHLLGPVAGRCLNAEVLQPHVAAVLVRRLDGEVVDVLDGAGEAPAQRLVRERQGRRDPPAEEPQQGAADGREGDQLGPQQIGLRQPLAVELGRQRAADPDLRGRLVQHGRDVVEGGLALRLRAGERDGDEAWPGSDRVGVAEQTDLLDPRIVGQRGDPGAEVGGDGLVGGLDHGADVRLAHAEVAHDGGGDSRRRGVDDLEAAGREAAGRAAACHDGGDEQQKTIHTHRGRSMRRLSHPAISRRRSSGGRPCPRRRRRGRGSQDVWP